MEEDVGVGDQQETEQGGRASGLFLALQDWKVWWLAFALTAQVVALSFNAYFPTLSATMGFNPTVTLLLVAPRKCHSHIPRFAWMIMMLIRVHGSVCLHNHSCSDTAEVYLCHPC